MRKWLTCLCLVAAPVVAARAQGGFLFQGVSDLELWKTDDKSTLLHRTNGQPGVIARGDVWAAVEPIRNVVLFGEVWAEGGSARLEQGGDIYTRQYGVRWAPTDAFSAEGGQIRNIVGTFSSRLLSFRNPLIAMPDGYAPNYPYGARVDGSAGKVDYRAGVLSLPLYREGYTPPPSHAVRPAIGAGITPTIGMRFGVSASAGPYLNDSFSASQLHAQDWKSFRQRVIAGDAQFSRGYFEGNAEIAHGSYDVPGRATAINGLSFYVEPKYTFTPRFYAAARYERNDYPFISPLNSTIWIANGVIVQDVELGAGYRPTARTLLKLSGRKDHWTPNANPNVPKDNGYAVALQWSQTWDFVELATRRR
ncbi:MAG: hypothetical protein ABIY52_13010 [Gemmatimonadaceae bacterium]